jgi:hypothetical protein
LAVSINCPCGCPPIALTACLSFSSVPLPLPVLGDEFHNGFFEGLGSFVRLPDQGRKKGGNKQLRAQDRAWREQQKKSATPDSSATRRLRWGRLP